MKLTKFLVIAAVLSARTCRTEVVLAKPSLDETTSNLVKDLVEIVTSCYGDRLDAVGLAGNLPDALSKTLSTEHLIPVVLIDNARNHMSNERLHVPGMFRRKIHVFIIAASNPQQLDILIAMNIRLSKFWNHMASFIIVDRSSGCINPVNYLLVAWKRNAINAKVLCYENESTKTIYNYNPFTDQAPVPWQRYAITRGIIDHPFTVFYQNYRADKSICVNLDFKKTKDLGGYEIRIKSPDYKVFHVDDHLKAFYRQTLLHVSIPIRINDLVWRTLNGTVKRTLVIDQYYTLYSRGGNYDMSELRMALLDKTESLTYPHESIGLVLVSKFRGHKSKRNEIFYVIDMYSWIGIVIVYLITVMFFKTFLNQCIMPALLNIVRLTCSMSISCSVDNTSSSIYLSSLLLFVIIMQGIIQCDLATQLTAMIPLKNIDTPEDIETFGYKLCLLPGVNVSTHFENPYFNRNVVVGNQEECFRRVRINDALAMLAACKGFTLDVAKFYNLHLSKKSIRELYAAFEIRHDWALEEPLNRIIARLIESDTLQPWTYRCSSLRLSDFQRDKTVENNSDYRQLRLADLTFAFIFLGAGLACATVCFIFELVTRYKPICSITIERRHSLPHIDPINYYYKVKK